MKETNEEIYKTIADKYSIVDNDKFIVIDESGYPLFKTYVTYENGFFVEYLPGGRSYPVDPDILKKCLEIYKGSLKKIEGD